MSRPEISQGVQWLNHETAISSGTHVDDKSLERSPDQPDDIGPGMKEVQVEEMLRLTAHRWQWHT